MVINYWKIQAKSTKYQILKRILTGNCLIWLFSDLALIVLYLYMIYERR